MARYLLVVSLAMLAHNTISMGYRVSYRRVVLEKIDSRFSNNTVQPRNVHWVGNEIML